MRRNFIVFSAMIGAAVLSFMINSSALWSDCWTTRCVVVWYYEGGDPPCGEGDPEGRCSPCPTQICCSKVYGGNPELGRLAVEGAVKSVIMKVYQNCWEIDPYKPCPDSDTYAQCATGTELYDLPAADLNYCKLDEDSGQCYVPNE